MFSTIIIFGISCIVPGQKSSCSAPKASAPPFRVGRTERSNVLGPVILILQVSVEPKYFNRDHMIALAEKLREKYGKKEAGGFFVLICDNYQVAKDDMLVHDLNTGQPNPGLRGLYDSSPERGKPSIGFSSARGRPLDEISISLDSQ